MDKPIAIVQLLTTDSKQYALILTAKTIKKFQHQRQEITDSLTAAGLADIGGSHVLSKETFEADPYFRRFTPIYSLTDFEKLYPAAKQHYAELYHHQDIYNAITKLI